MMKREKIIAAALTAALVLMAGVAFASGGGGGHDPSHHASAPVQREVHGAVGGQDEVLDEEQAVAHRADLEAEGSLERGLEAKGPVLVGHRLVPLAGVAELLLDLLELLRRQPRLAPGSRLGGHHVPPARAGVRQRSTNHNSTG